jgi:hypothetical protein
MQSERELQLLGLISGTWGAGRPVTRIDSSPNCTSIRLETPQVASVLIEVVGARVSFSSMATLEGAYGGRFMAAKLTGIN